MLMNAGQRILCLDMNAEILQPCLHPPNTDAHEPFSCTMGGELVFQCRNGECEDSGALKDNTQPKGFDPNCHFLHFANVKYEFLDQHFICNTSQGIFYHYLQTCPGKSRPSPPLELLNCSNHKEKNGGRNVGSAAGVTLTIGAVMLVAVVR